MTRQRKAVLEALQATRSHPTALQVFDAVRDRVPGITLATVYRNLRVLQVAGMVREVEVGGEAGRFDARTDDHAHVRCEKCGRVDDVPLDLPRELSEEAAQQAGYQITSCDLSFAGICPECRSGAA